MTCDEVLEALVRTRERLPQGELQASKESQGVQTVEGEAAGERQQISGRVDRPGRRVCHHVAIHGAVQCSCGQGEVVEN